MTPTLLLLAGCGAILAGGLASLLLARRPAAADRAYAVLMVAGTLAGIGAAVAVLTGQPGDVITLEGSLPGGPWVLGLDLLSAWFLLLIMLVGGCAGVFGVFYLRPERGHRPVATAQALYALLLVSLAGVVSARAMAPFLTAWEIMAVTAYFLIMFEREEAEVRRAGFLYVALTHVSTLALLLLFAILSAGGPGRSFDAFQFGAPITGSLRTLALLLALVGFGIKAGVIPLHVWLPGAHSVAPSHVSAVLSGVMLKMGIYGLLRTLMLLGAPPAWLGWTLSGLGLLSGVLGILWALAERDLKRVLAYSSVENLGIILLGMGVGVLGVAYQQPAVAVLGFAASLLHTLNHALFKSLLFLGAGAVLRATGTRLVDRLGGLGRELPWTAMAFGVGAVAITGLPPLNGFVSEWVAVQGLLAAGRQPGALTLLLLGVAGLGLIGALALACFTRIVGAVFLGQPRRDRPPAREDPGLVAPLLVLLSGCLLVGLVPVVVVRPALAATMALVAASTGVSPALESDTLPAAAILVSLVSLAVLGLGVAIWWVRRRSGRAFRPAESRTWGCAYARPSARMQYTAGSFTTPLLLAFGRAAAPAVTRAAGALESHPRDRVLEGAVRPLWQRARAMAAVFRPLQQGPVTRYLQYIVLTLLFLLAALFASIVTHG